MSERDELRDLIQSNMHRIDGFERWTFQAPVDMSDAILAAGYRKPRTITTREEIVALNVRTIIRDADDETWELTDSGWRYWVYDVPFDSLELTLPATVLWEPLP